MYPGGGLNWLWIWGVVDGLWLLGLTVVVWQSRLFLKRLFPENTLQGDGCRDSFQDKLKELFGKVGELDGFREQNLGCVQKIALRRYNPYRDTGGDQSFSVALLDGRGDGVVITSLHSRAGTRVFAKPVVKGREGVVRFSREEEEVAQEAGPDKHNA